MTPDPARGHASEREAREVAESAREKRWKQRSFVKSLLSGRFHLDWIHPHPLPEPGEQFRASHFLRDLEEFARAHIDGDAVDREAWVPEEVLDGLRALGAFGIKIPREYGGLGLSQITYNRALEIVASRCISTAAFLSAHQSIGVPQPLSYFGTEAQKRAYLPRLAAGALSAFALTEPEAGSDPANMSTTATPTADGSAYLLNGEKLWCTNGPRAELLVVMARTPARAGVKGKRPISAFIVDRAWPGVEVVHTSRFMGLRGLSNGVLRFTNVRVPRENLLWGEGLGLKLALITLNTGRLSLPALCAAAGKSALHMCRRWCRDRVQWGAPVGRHDAVAQMLGRMAANAFAMEAVMELSSVMADAKTFDIRIEAAMAKLWNSETAWALADDAVQMRSGRGYETADSLRARGEEMPAPVERLLRDLRINRIFEGSSEIMRLFIAREAVDQHLKLAGALVDPRAPFRERMAAAARAGLHYAWWYPTRWVGWSRWPRFAEFGRMAGHVGFIERSSRKLARALFYCMLRFGAGLEKRQAVLGRIVDIGSELFAMTAVIVRVDLLAAKTPGDSSPEDLADLFCRHARRRIRAHFAALFSNDDVATYKVAARTMEGAYGWLEEGVVTMADVEAMEEAEAAASPGSTAKQAWEAALAAR